MAPPDPGGSDAALSAPSALPRTVGWVPQTLSPRPFLRWAGGKRQLLPTLLAAMPARVGRFYEPFLGGGALYFSVGIPGGRCVVSDVNPELLAAYRAIQSDPEALIAQLGSLAESLDLAEFLRIRATEPATLSELERAGRMIYLNRTCFNGLYRVNSSGRFNVPWGKLANPEVCNSELLRSNSARLAGTEIRELGFAEAVADAQAGDFVYLDPPYIPLSPTASFSRYATGDFRRPEQEALAATIAELMGRGVRVMLSNSDTALTRAIYDIAGLELYSISVARSIAAKGSSRSRVGEVLGLSYGLEEAADPARAAALLGAAAHEVAGTPA